MTENKEKERNEARDAAFKAHKLFGDVNGDWDGWDASLWRDGYNSGFSNAGIAFAESQGGCEWSNGDEEPYQTSCGQSFEFADDGIKENSFKFCPFCGGKISEPAGSEDK